MHRWKWKCNAFAFDWCTQAAQFAHFKKLVKLKVGDNKIKSENIEIAILIFKLLHRAGADFCARRKYAQTDRHTHTHTQTEIFFIVVVTRASVAASRHRHALHVYFGSLGGGPCLLQFAAARAGDPGGSFILCNELLSTVYVTVARTVHRCKCKFSAFAFNWCTEVAQFKKFVKLKVGDNKIKSENIEIAILISNLLHRARAGVCARA